jgi:DNA-3-methyladenine glycosylase
VRRLESDADTTRLSARIVEVEVYTGDDDPSSHASRGTPTDRTQPMFERPGTLYVYRIYGMWDCLNVTAKPTGEPAAILIRAAEPIAGVRQMGERRDVQPPGPPHETWPTATQKKLLSGPGKLCQAMEITPEVDSTHIGEANVWMEAGERSPETPPDDIAINQTPRIGLNRETVGDAVDWPWRYTDRESSFLSR